jgi:hypothetical protein
MGKISGSHCGEYEDHCLLECCAVSIALMMETVSTSETSVKFYQITRRNIPEDIFLNGQSTQRGTDLTW